MNVIWLYLDKKAATVKALKDFPKMQHILEHTDEEIGQVYSTMAGIGSPRLDGMPHAHNPQSCEDRILAGAEEIDVLKERRRQAEEYLRWFKPCWDALTEDERFVLSVFYLDEKRYGTGAAEMVADYFSIERASAYRRKERALDALSTLLYGRW